MNRIPDKYLSDWLSKTMKHLHQADVERWLRREFGEDEAD